MTLFLCEHMFPWGIEKLFDIISMRTFLCFHGGLLNTLYSMFGSTTNTGGTYSMFGSTTNTEIPPYL